MKLMKINSLSPKRLFRSKKDRSTVSRSDPPSFASSSSSDSLHKPGPAAAGTATPTSVLPDISGEWSEFSSVDMAQAFKLIDRDNDGVVTRTELEALLKRLLGAEPPSQEEVAMMLSEVDRDGDGCIPLEALLHRFGPAFEPAADSESELREAFEVFDTDHDGKISAEELFSVFTAIGDDRCTLEDCRRMIAEVDKNGDGFVCFQDFALMMDLRR